MNLTDKVILVTAATRGIGAAIVKKCASAGGQVFLAARDRMRAEERVAQLRREGLHVNWVYQDATKPETYTSMVEQTVAQAGHLDVLINNFGTSDPKVDLDFSHTEPADFFRILERNLQSVFLGTQAAVKHMKDGGSIVNISSVGGQVPDISQVAYGTSKAAINYLTKLIALQEAQHRIRCNAVLPGMTATDSVQKKLTPEFRRLFQRHIPLGRMGTVEDVANLVAFLASEEAAYITGQIIAVSGGFGLGSPLYADLSSGNAHR